MRVSKTPLTMVERLAFVAYQSLVADGKSYDPTLHDISHAVVQAAPLLKIVDLPDAIDLELQAVKMLCENNACGDNTRIVVSLDHYQRGLRADRRTRRVLEGAHG